MAEEENSNNRGCGNILIIALVALFVVVIGAILVFLHLPTGRGRDADTCTHGRGRRN